MKSVAVFVVIFALEVNSRGAVTWSGAYSEGTVFQKSDPALRNFIRPKESSPAAEAILAFEAGYHDEAVNMARKIATSGDIDAIYLLGFAYETGQGVPQFRKKALEYYERGALRGDAESLYRLSSLLVASDNEADVIRAREMLEEHAAEEPKVAGRILGEAFLQGRFSGEPEPVIAVEWWKQSAEAGDVHSMNLLAGFYDGQLGFSEQRDAGKAVEFYRAAAEEGDSGAMLILASKLLSREDFMRDEEEGRKWLTKAIATVQPAGYLALAKSAKCGWRDQAIQGAGLGAG